MARGKEICITQINLNRSHHGWDDILGEVKTRNHIILTQEPPLTQKQKRIKSSNGYIAIYDKAATRPRAGIMVHKDFSRNILLLDPLTDGDTSTILFKAHNKSIVICSMYMDREKPCPPPLLHRVAAYATKYNYPLVIGTDSNAHSSLWGSRMSDVTGRNRGDALVESLLREDLHVLNRNSVKTFDNGRWSNAIDLTIANNQGADLVRQWQTCHIHCHTDHIPITFRLGGTNSSNMRSFYNPKRTDWKQYNSHTKTLIAKSSILHRDITNVQDLEDHTNELTKILLESYHKCTPLTHVSATKKDPVWLTQEVKEARKSMISALSLAQSGRTPQLWEEAKKASKAYKKIIAHSKSKAWKTWAGDLDALSDTKRIGQLVKTAPDASLSCLYKEDGSLTSDPIETLEIMRDVHFGERDTTRPSLPPLQRGENEEWPDQVVFSKNRILRALEEFKPLTAAGPDNIRPIMMQKAAETFIPCFQKIAIASYSLGITPSSWQEAEAIYLPKPGKEDYRLPKSFRTITLSSNLQKLMERLILWHIEVDQKVHKNLNKNQYGFRRGASTDTALHKVVRKIEHAIMNRGIAMATFLDIEGAFDNVAFAAIERALNNKLKDSKTAKWITFMISNRKITTSLLGQSISFMVTRGCPQGGILSPFLWNIVMDDLLSFDKRSIPGDLQGFADDISLLAITTLPSNGNPAADILPLREVTQKSLIAISKWCKSVGLKLSAMKSHIVIFTHRTNITLPKPIKVMGHEIEIKKSTKFLGVTLDSKLNWSEHIENQTRKCKRILFQCRRVVGPSWGLSPKTMTWIYRAMVRPVLSYGALVWVNAMLLKKNRTNTGRIQRLALLMVTGAMSSTPGSALDAITNTTPIHDHLKTCAVKTAYNLKVANQWEGRIAAPSSSAKKYTSHANTMDDILNIIPKEWDHDHTVPHLILDRAFSTEIPTREDFKSEDKEHTITAYTDGSKMDNKAGAGLLIRQGTNLIHSESIHLGETTTVPLAEMVAIQKTTKHLLSNGTANEKILINCDSQGTILSLNSTVCRSKTTINTITNLNVLAVFNSVKIRWIPAHKGHEGNELADTLAKKGAKDITNITRPPIPKPAAYAALREKIKLSSLASSPLTKHMKLFWNHTHLTHLRSLDRRHLRAATQLLTGHNHLKYHMHKIKLAQTAECRLCGMDSETVKHLLTVCPATWALKQERFDRMGLTLDDIKNVFPFKKTLALFLAIQQLLAAKEAEA